MEILFTFLALKKPNSEEYIFAVYKYRLSLLTLSLKFLSNNLSLWHFYDRLLPLKF